jgi:hypothetical protein
MTNSCAKLGDLEDRGSLWLLRAVPSYIETMVKSVTDAALEDLNRLETSFVKMLCFHNFSSRISHRYERLLQYSLRSVDTPEVSSI